MKSQKHSSCLKVIIVTRLGKFYVTLPLTENITIAEMIAEMNICTCTWKGTDYIKGAIMSHPSNVTDVLRYMAELETKGYSLPAISMYVTGTENVKKRLKDVKKYWKLRSVSVFYCHHALSQIG